MHSPGRRAFVVRRVGTALASAALLGASLALAAPQAAADPAAKPDNFSRTTPGDFSVTVPNGVCAVKVEARGGAGGSVVTGVSGTNGAGADITVTYPAVPGQVFSGTVGAGGKPSTGGGGPAGNGGSTPGEGGAGVGAGGKGGTVGAGSSHAGAGGGGGTLVKANGVDLIFAGGGGGSAGGHATDGGFGGNAGLPSSLGAVTKGSDGMDGFDNPNGQGQVGSGIPRGGQGGQESGPGAGGVHTTHGGLSGSGGAGQNGGTGGTDPNYDSGGGGGGGYTGAGGGASTTGNGAGAAAKGGNAGGGGGGGSSLVANTTPSGTGSPSGLSSEAGPRLGSSHNGAGADGLVTLTWVLCDYDLAVDKQVSGPDQTGLTTWTVKVTNNGDADMTIGDTVTLTDTLPGPANTKVTSVDTPAGVTCDIAVDDPMASTVECSRDLDFTSVGGDKGKGGLKKGESITIVYTQTLTAVGTYANTAKVTDRGDQKNNESKASTEVTGPTADPGTSRGPKGEPQSWAPEVEEGTFPVNCAATLQLIDPLTGNPTSQPVVVAGEGTYTVDGCKIVFTPEADFVGTPTNPIEYQVKDSQGNPARSTYTPTVTVVPIAVDDKSEGPWNTSQSVKPLANDEPGDPAVPLEPSSLTLVGADADGNVTVPEGVYTIDRTNPLEPTIVFTPNQDYYGTPTPVQYQVKDSADTPAQATYRPFVYAPPIAKPVTSSGLQGQPQIQDPDVTARNVPLVDGSLKIWDPVAEQWTTDPVTIDPAEGTYSLWGDQLVFTPVQSFTGTAKPVGYQVTDERDQTADSTYTPTVTTVKPIASNDFSVGRPNEPQSTLPLTNDQPGHPDVPLVPSTLTLLDGELNPAPSVTVPEGVYTVDRTDPANPRIVFTPNEDYVGTPTPVSYRVQDTNGTGARAVYQPKIITDPPATNHGVTSGPQGLPQSWEPTPVAGDDFDIDFATLTLLDNEGQPVEKLEKPGFGTYTVVDGKIVFTPEPAFVGQAPTVDYRISDKGGQHAKATYTPSVTAVTPVAKDDGSTGRPNQPQSVDPLANDAPGDPRVPLDPATLTLLDADGDPALSVAVPEGEYTVVEGKIVFTPKENYFGPVTPVDYRVQDANGTPAEATYTPTILVDPPTTDSGETTGPQGLLQLWEPEPVAGQDFAIDPATLTLLGADGNPVPEIEVEDVGTYTVVGNEIHFQPVPSFVGKAPTVSYGISDVAGQQAKGTYTPSVTAVVPVANDDDSTGWWNTPQSVDPLANDEPGDPAVPLDPESLTLLDANGSPASSVTVPEGVYSIDRSDPEEPRIVFTPNRDYTGTPTPVNYRVADENGTPAEAAYQPEVRGPEDSQDLVETRVCGKPATFDTVGEIPDLDPASVRLRDADGALVTELVVPGEGTWRVDTTTGKVTFTPVGCLDEDPTPVAWDGRLTDGTPIVGTLTVLYVELPDTDDGDKTHPNTGVNPLLPLGLAGLFLTGGLVLVGIRRRNGLTS